MSNTKMENTSAEHVESKDNLGVDKLNVDFDYLLYKIKDYISTIELQTNEMCRKRHQLITKDIIEDIVDKNIADFKELLAKCEDLENYYNMLDQIEVITGTFEERLNQIVLDYSEIDQ
ncbi:hypothetical protein TPHA_0H01690 [Tetrapisispora phaffii CBS 4417]|uniref:Biogenesis of lysosome-related organelles complex 1 subunit CNL1 n=1 Tax=Tetrapisispora phaffii (strain ATCC 24235 / CBS 4417 / NBRC 1672 / NRRL Y-8282 / UCD 70-5) TaxID=1071381 RepID=G8BX71_TETPH|nr:hypothetical protein TPHA_0H01690 [Tetrapisispora phaffii CBS 4417]CCE64375.1 hypothetical protein TPHA_0H01690 [Tetrapisispora phaffii CBS 4417]